MMRIAIAEDDESFRARLRNYVQRFSKETSMPVQIFEYSDGRELAGSYKPVYDLILLDVQMPYLDGYQVAKEIRKVDQDVILIFVTNLAQYALKGYEVNAYDFVIKPVAYPLFEQKMKKVTVETFGETYTVEKC